MIGLNYKIHSGNVGSYFSNFDFKNFFNVTKYAEGCVERGGEKRVSS